MTHIAVSGATGAMGQTLRTAIADREDVSLGLAVTRADDDALGDSVPVVAPEAIEEALEGHHVDVLVDFTAPSVSVELVTAAAEAGVAAVVGTTGFESAQFDALRASAEAVPVLVAPNFSRGIQALLPAIEAAVARLPGYDIEVTETHHNRKRDAPSGTARQFLETIESERAVDERVHGRAGDAPRSSGEIGVHSRRAGTITGEHEVLIAANDEELRLVHRAESRHVFAAGALDAAAWVVAKPPGWYRFAEVLES